MILFLLAAIGLISSFFSGLVGMGGAVISYPMLLYVPKALGLAGFTALQISGMVALQVLFAALSGLTALRRDRVLHVPLIAYMGTAIVIGSLCGGFGAAYLSSSFIHGTYAVVAAIAAVMMFLPGRERQDIPAERLEFSKAAAIAIALPVGAVSGIVGVGGGFLLIPMMLNVLKLPLRITIACSMAITFASSVATNAGKIAGGSIPSWPAAVLIFTSLIAAPLGVKAGKRLKSKHLKTAAGMLILAGAVKIWLDIFS